MPDTLAELLNKTDVVIASCRGVVSDEDVERFALVARNVRTRLSYPEDLVVVALAGGTGSGKSSILNVIADEEVADVGGVRPTTSSPLAVVPLGRAGAIGGFLTELGVDLKTVSDLPEWLVLIDLPDTDSVEVDHRFRVESLLPRVDLVVWITDPEKYRDSVFHDEFLKPLAASSKQMRFVVNQVDRVGSEGVDALLADFASALADDGIGDPQILATAATPTSGPSEGIDDLLAALRPSTSPTLSAHSKLVTDLSVATAEMNAQVGSSGVDYDRRSSDVVETASVLIVDGEGGAAASKLSTFVGELADETGGPVGVEIQEVAVGIPHLVQGIREALAAAVVEYRRARPRIRWSDKGDHMPRGPRLELVSRQLGSSLDPPLRRVLSRRAAAQAALADLSLSLTAASPSSPVISASS